MRGKMPHAKTLVLLMCLCISSIHPAGAGFSPGSAADSLAAQAVIRRDTYGVPHILAESEAAAAFAQGYATAEDHVHELARLFLRARSEEASVFGPRFAESDLLTLELGMREGAKAGYRKMAPWATRILDAYAAGYNLYLDRHRGELPSWVRPVDGIDVLAHARRVILMEFSMDLRALRDVARPRTAPPAAEEGSFKGSNMWAIGRERSASGRGLLLANPHLAWGGSQLFHEVHLTVPGRINISGATLIGTPGVAIGFNEHLGWSHTVNTHDSTDIYELTLGGTDGDRYIYDGLPHPLEKSEITIRVLTDQGLETRTKEIYRSHHGPVLRREASKAYAFKFASLDEYRFVEQWHLMAKATGLEEFRRILDMQAIPMFNIVYADREGNIFYIFNGRFPERPAGFHWSGVVPGNTSASEWNRMLPQARLPQLVNPPGGYVQNCNSSPWYTNLRNPIDRRLFPADLTPNFNDLRSQLSLQMLENDDSITLEEVLAYKNNTKLLLADRIKESLLAIARNQATDGGLSKAVRVLEAWDNSAARDSRGGVLFAAFWEQYRRKAKPVFEVEWSERAPAATPRGIGDPAAALRCLADAAAQVEQKFGRLDVPWGEVYRLRRGTVDVPLGGHTGELGAFRIVGYEEEKDGRFAARGGDSYVLAVEFTSPPTAYSVTAYSQSSNPASRHHTDQSLLFAREEWKRAWFTEEDIAKNLSRSYRPGEK